MHGKQPYLLLILVLPSNFFSHKFRYISCVPNLFGLILGCGYLLLSCCQSRCEKSTNICWVGDLLCTTLKSCTAIHTDWNQCVFDLCDDWRWSWSDVAKRRWSDSNMKCLRVYACLTCLFITESSLCVVSMLKCTFCAFQICLKILGLPLVFIEVPFFVVPRHCQHILPLSFPPWVCYFPFHEIVPANDVLLFDCLPNCVSNCVTWDSWNKNTKKIALLCYFEIQDSF